jgi:hypothetical protein
MSGVDHSVIVTAGTLYEAVALGLAAIRSEEWVEGIPEGLNAVKVSASNVPVEHSVQMKDFTAWLKKEGGSPRESSDRLRIRQILGIVTSK